MNLMNFFNDENDAIMTIVGNAYTSAYKKNKEEEEKKKKNAELTKLAKEQVMTWITEPTKPKETYISPMPPVDEKKQTMVEKKKAELYFDDPKKFKKLYGEVSYLRYGQKPEVAAITREKELAAIEAAKTPEEKEKTELYWSSPKKYQELYGEAPDKVKGVGLQFPVYQPTAEQFTEEVKKALPKPLIETADVVKAALGNFALQIAKTGLTGSLALLEKDYTYSEETERLGFEPVKKADSGETVEKINKAIDFLEEAQANQTKGIEEEWQKNVFALASGATSIGAAIGLAAITKNPDMAIAVLSGLESSDTYLEARDAGLSPERAFELAGASFVGTYALERVGFDYLMGTSTIISKFLAEAGQETAQQFFQETVSNIGYEKAYSPIEEYWRTYWTAGATGGGVSIALSFAEGSPEAKLSKELQVMGMEEAQAEIFIKDLSVYGSAMGHDMMGSLRQTYSFKEARLAHLKGLKKGVPGVDYAVPVDIYEQAKVVTKPTTFQDFKKANKDFAGEMGKWADKYLGNISTRLKNIDASLKYKMRQFEFDTNQQTMERTKIAEPVLKKLSTMERTDYNVFDLAAKNGDVTMMNKIVDKYEMRSQVEDLRKMLDTVHKEANKVGFDIGYRENYFPRMIKDTKGFLDYFYQQDDWPLLSRAIQERQTKVGRELTPEEQANVINTLLRGFKVEGVMLSRTGQMKARKLDKLTPELNQYYYDVGTSTLKYIRSVSEAIEARKFFGKGDANINDSIASYVMDLMADGKLKPSQEKDLVDILKARFNPKGTTGLVNFYKNFSYIDTMGSPTSAITQIGDLAFAIYKAGVVKTAKGLYRSATGKAKITKEDLGIEEIAAEYEDASKMSRAVHATFKLTGLETMDKFGKETIVNGVLEDLQAQAKKPVPRKELRERIEPIFEERTDSVIEDLRSEELTYDVKLLLFNELADVQPIALSEMPAGYVSGGNFRLFYMLKSYTLKLYDVYRNDIFQEIAKGDKDSIIRGSRNMIRLTMALVVMNGSADMLKDLLLGRELNMDDLVVDNIWKLFGVNRYVTWQARQEGISSAIQKLFLPPFKFIDAVGKDVFFHTEGKGFETPASVPVVGKMYYWWYGRGAEKLEERQIGGSEKAKDIFAESDERVVTPEEGEILKNALKNAVDEGSMTDQEAIKKAKSFKDRQDKVKEADEIIEKLRKKDLTEDELIAGLRAMNEDGIITKTQIEYIKENL